MSQTATFPRGPMTPPISPVPAMSVSGVPSIGDVLMLSQISWRTARAFNSGRRCAESVPTEFVDIEAELNRLSKSLKHLAETLVSESTESFVSSGDRAAQDGIGAILLSCRRTLEDLESITSMYQTNRRTKTAGGFTLERHWNQSLLEGYDSFVWTADGGTIRDLHEFLRMHTITLCMVTSISET
jgi:hypothetical protein